MSKKQTKTKAPACAVPTTREEAERLLAELGSDQRNANAITDRANAKVTEIQLATAEALKPINELIDAKFEALYIYAQAHRRELLEGDAKTVKLASGTLSWRFTPPSVQIARGKTQEVLDYLVSDDELCSLFLRTTVALDKEELLKQYAGDNKEVVESIPHLKITRTEEFAAKPLDMDQEFIETVRPAKKGKK